LSRLHQCTDWRRASFPTVGGRPADRPIGDGGRGARRQWRHKRKPVSNRFLPRDAMLAQYMRSSCVCVSVTLRYCIKMAKRRFMQIAPHDSSGTLSFVMPKITAKFERDHPLREWQMQVEWVKIGHFRQKRYNSKMVQDRHIVFIKVE